MQLDSKFIPECLSITSETALLVTFVEQRDMQMIFSNPPLSVLQFTETDVDLNKRLIFKTRRN